MRGITDILARVFWPGYNYRKATRDLGTPTSTKGPKTKRGGMRRGNEVDHQIRAFTNDSQPVTHPFARKLLKALELQGLTPYRAQVRVQDDESELFTGVDLVCRDVKHKFVLVEIKTGFSRAGAAEAANGKMRGILCEYTNCAKNQHAVQTAVTRYLFMKTFPEHSPPDALVARVGDDGVFLCPVPADILKKAKGIVAAISKCRARPKKAFKSTRRQAARSGARRGAAAR